MSTVRCKRDIFNVICEPGADMSGRLFCRDDGNIAREGTVFQVFYLGPSFYFI